MGIMDIGNTIFTCVCCDGGTVMACTHCDIRSVWCRLEVR
jgi:hypothetical protein